MAHTTSLQVEKLEEDNNEREIYIYKWTMNL